MGLDRRAFITFVAGVAAAAPLTPLAWKPVDDISIWTQNWQWTPKIPNRAMYFSQMASKMDPSGAGIRVCLAGDNPCAVYGDAEQPLSKGGVTAMAANEVKLLYSPSRVRRPMRRTAGGLEPVSWNEALDLLAAKLDAAGDKVAFINGDETGTAGEVFSAFTAARGGKYFMMPTEAQSAAKAWSMLGGSGEVGYDIEKSDYVLMLGADALESWGTVVRNARAFGDSHPADAQAGAQYVFCGPVQNNTATVADRWVPARPGSMETLALGLAHQLIKAGAKADTPDFGAFKARLGRYTPEHVAEVTGVSVREQNRMVQELAQASRPLVLAGSEFGHGAGAGPVMAGLALNVLLGRVDKPGGLRSLPEAPTVVAGAKSRRQAWQDDLVAWMGKVSSGTEQVELAMIYDANPAYALPAAADVADALKKVPFTVSFNTFMDETAETADLILPSSMTLERHDDVYTPYGSGLATYTRNKPVMAPAFDTRHAADAVLAVAGRLGMDLGYKRFTQVLAAKADALGVSGKGGKTYVADATAGPARLNLTPAASEPVSPADSGKIGGLALAPVNRRNLGTSKVAMPPICVNTVRRGDIDGDAICVSMNSRTAREQGLRAGDTVSVAGSRARLTAKVAISERVMDGVVAAPMGLGHTAFNDASGKGGNVYTLLSVADEPASGLTKWTGSTVAIAKA